MTIAYLQIDEGDAIETTLESFIADNEFGDDDAEDIRADFAFHGFASGGGGAAPEWRIFAEDQIS